jgi:hypothetical protein
MAPTADECPSGCGRTQQPGKFLCRPCWGEVPKDLQANVLSTWAAVRVGHRRQLPAEERRPRLAAYRQAREAALAAIA